MARGRKKEERARLQARVANLVWGGLMIAAGVLFVLDQQGRVDLGVGGFAAGRAVDGDPGTRWSSEFADDQWIAVDLGVEAEITRIELIWEEAHAVGYRVQLSSDGSSWTTMVEVTDGDGERDVHELAASARYVRVECVRRGTQYGYSLWELAVYGRSGASGVETLLSAGRPATASSVEPVYLWSYWMLYWPVMLVAGGLPLLLAPKDRGEQIAGLVLAGIGALLLLRNLELTSWGFREAAPVVIALIGLMLVVQSLRQALHSDAGSDEDAGESS